MSPAKKVKFSLLFAALVAVALSAAATRAQLPDRTQNPNTARAGINKSLVQQIGAGRGDVMTPDSSAFIIARDPFRAIRRGRQLFQRKFLRSQGQGPLAFDAVGDLEANFAIGAGLTDSCAACHGRPRGSAGFGGDVATRPDSRDAPHLFGLGLKEMLADEITAELRAIRAQALTEARVQHRSVTKPLIGKGINYGALTAQADGTLDTSQVEGVDADLRVRPFFAHGGTVSIREFIIGAFNDEMGLQSADPDVAKASEGGHVVTPSGMVLDGTTDFIKPPPAISATEDPDGDGVANEIPTSLVDFMEFYLLNYFKPALAEQTDNGGTANVFFPRRGYNDQSGGAVQGRAVFQTMGCTVCHIPDLTINRDRRVADLDTVFDPIRGNLNRLFATAIPLFNAVADGSAYPTLKQPNYMPFVVKNIFTDFKRHDLGANFHEIVYDGKIRQEFMTAALWGVGTTAPYGHDGRSITLTEVILRHGV